MLALLAKRGGRGYSISPKRGKELLTKLPSSLDYGQGISGRLCSPSQKAGNWEQGCWRWVRSMASRPVQGLGSRRVERRPSARGESGEGLRWWPARGGMARPFPGFHPGLFAPPLLGAGDGAWFTIQNREIWGTRRGRRVAERVVVARAGRNAGPSLRSGGRPKRNINASSAKQGRSSFVSRGSAKPVDD